MGFVTPRNVFPRMKNPVSHAVPPGRSVMGGAGTAMMGIGRGSGKNRAEESAQSAISSALLDVPITGAQGIVFNVLGGKDMSLQEVRRRHGRAGKGGGWRRIGRGSVQELLCLFFSPWGWDWGLE